MAKRLQGESGNVNRLAALRVVPKVAPLVLGHRRHPAEDTPERLEIPIVSRQVVRKQEPIGHRTDRLRRDRGRLRCSVPDHVEVFVKLVGPAVRRRTALRLDHPFGPFENRMQILVVTGRAPDDMQIRHHLRRDTIVDRAISVGPGGALRVGTPTPGSFRVLDPRIRMEVGSR